jgi:hypothetical protein
MYMLLAVCTGILAITSCEKDEPVPPYVGTWSISWDVAEEGDTIWVKDILTLTADTYSEVLQLRYHPTGSWRTYFGMRGSLSVSGNIMTIKIDKAGFSTVDDQDRPTGNVVYYSKGTEEYNAIIQFMGLNETITAEFSVTGDKLVLFIDLNGDGDVLDPGELSLFIRE